MCQSVFQSGCRHELFVKPPDGSTLQPEQRMAVLRALNLETGTPIRRLGCHPAPGEMQILGESGISTGGSSQQWRKRHQKKRKSCLEKDQRKKRKSGFPGTAGVSGFAKVSGGGVNC